MKLDRDISLQESLNLMGWDPSEDKHARFAQWLHLDCLYGESMERISTVEEIADGNPSCNDFGDTDLFVSDQRGYAVILS